VEFPFFDSHQTARLAVEADFDPQLPLRVLHRFTEIGALPNRFVTEATSPDRPLRIEVEFTTAVEPARLLARRLLTLPSTLRVDLSFRRERTAAAPRRARA